MISVDPRNLILETEAKNALGTLVGDFTDLWKLCEPPPNRSDEESGTRASVSRENAPLSVSGSGGRLQRARGVFKRAALGTTAGLLSTPRWEFYGLFYVCLCLDSVFTEEKALSMSCNVSAKL